MPAPIYLINQSTNVTNQDGQQIADACGTQLERDVAPSWGLIATPVHFVPSGVALPTGGWNVVLMDTLDQADAAGYHLEDGQGIHGVVGTRVWLDNGGTVLTGPNSVASTASHEIVELFADAPANIWRDTENGWAVVQELCDPVEGDTYPVGTVSCSNFVYPAWFDPHSPAGSRFDYMGKLTRSFTMDAGGYFVWERESQTAQSFAEQVPQWKRDVKTHPASRVARIMARTTHKPT